MASTETLPKEWLCIKIGSILYHPTKEYLNLILRLGSGAKLRRSGLIKYSLESSLIWELWQFWTPNICKIKKTVLELQMSLNSALFAPLSPYQVWRHPPCSERQEYLRNGARLFGKDVKRNEGETYSHYCILAWHLFIKTCFNWKQTNPCVLFFCSKVSMCIT